MRAIIFLLFVVLVFLIVRFTINRVIEIREKQRLAEVNRQKSQNPEASQEMVRCIQSGVHIPKSEAYFDGENYFSSEQAMRQYHASKAE